MIYKRLKILVITVATVLLHNLYSRLYQNQLAACLLVAIIEMTHSSQAEKKEKEYRYT